MALRFARSKACWSVAGGGAASTHVRLLFSFETTFNMTPYQKRATEITLRMAQDMKIRGMAQTTTDAYTYHVGRFHTFLFKPLEKATLEDIRRFQLEMIEKRKLAYSSFNQAVCSLRFLYSVTLPRDWQVERIPFARRPKRLPLVLLPIRQAPSWQDPTRQGQSPQSSQSTQSSN